MIVLMKDVYGWSHTEIAESLDISVSASKVRLHRAHLRLRDMLEHTDG
jgi:RNA polymerase sigma-70 factor (ECF subfamily)